MPTPPDWDAIDQASLESFPASDPPARGSLRAAPSASTVELPEPVIDLDLEQRKRSIRIAVGVLAASAVIGVVIWRLSARRAGHRAPWN